MNTSILKTYFLRMTWENSVHKLIICMAAIFLLHLLSNLNFGCWMIFISYFICRTPSFGPTDHYQNRWSVQLQMMSAFFSTSIIRWWRNWIKDLYGILQFVVLCTAGVFASMIMIMLIGNLFLPFRVFIIWIARTYYKCCVEIFTNDFRLKKCHLTDFKLQNEIELLKSTRVNAST